MLTNIQFWTELFVIGNFLTGLFMTGRFMSGC